MSLPLSPDMLTMHLSKEKALAVAKDYPDAVIIGADTVVAIDGAVLGKAHTKEDAQRMLSMLSGKTHQVITGLTVIIPAGESPTGVQIIESVASINDVTFKPLAAEEIEWYIQTGEPLEKAGAYGIQGFGAMFVEKIEGSYSGIVGLPLEILYEIFRRNDYMV
jgi:septum formation protein